MKTTPKYIPRDPLFYENQAAFTNGNSTPGQPAQLPAPVVQIQASSYPGSSAKTLAKRSRSANPIAPDQATNQTSNRDPAETSAPTLRGKLEIGDIAATNVERKECNKDQSTAWRSKRMGTVTWFQIVTARYRSQTDCGSVIGMLVLESGVLAIGQIATFLVAQASVGEWSSVQVESEDVLELWRAHSF